MNLLFYLPALFFLISGLPQMIKLIKSKESKDISLWTYILTCLGISIIVLDAFLAKNYSILISNAVSLFITGINTILIIRYRKT